MAETLAQRLGRRGRWLWRGLALSGRRVQRSPYGQRLTGPAFDATFQLSIYGEYGSFVRDSIVALPPDAVFLDIGANVGVFSVLAGSHLSAGRVIAFEPNPYVYRHLVENVALNGLRHVVPVCAAVMPGELQSCALSFNRDHSGQGSVAGGGGLRRTVTCLAGGAGLLDLAFEEGRRYAAKIDVEGAEHAVVRALSESRLWPSVERITIELSDMPERQESSRETVAFLEAQGFCRAGRSADGPHRDELFVRDGRRGD